MVTTLESPMLTGLRSAASRLIQESGMPDDLSGIDVVLDAHRTLAATPSFADEIVRDLLVERGAQSLTIRVAGRDFTRWLLQSAAEHEVADRVIIADPTDR